MMVFKPIVLVAGLAFATAVSAQFDPQGSQVTSYFPQVADGGSASQHWITSLTFVNPNATLSVTGTVNFYANNGSALALDFGAGPVTSFPIAIPPQGTVVFTTIGAPESVAIGWAVATSNLPVQGVVQYRYSVNGVPQQGVSALATEASALFRSPASSTTGVAIANPSLSALGVKIAALDPSGVTVTSNTVTLGPLGHGSFTLSQVLTGLPANFRGTVIVSTTAPNTYAVAWTLSTDLGVLASYPPSALNWPISQYERISKVWQKVLGVAAANYPLGTAPRLVIDPSVGQINSFASTSLNEVHIFMNMAELISDSESELAFVLGHELGHIIQTASGGLQFSSNTERDADGYGLQLALGAGYDPYGGGGALAKLAMASSTPTLINPGFDNIQANLGTDPHSSFLDRLGVIFQSLQSVCLLPQNQALCGMYKATVHSHFPLNAPL
ncbi:MAG: M48 family metalloprotease [Acidobacteriia bacterium]|nr:M48 family metalloprotease [Terriglobia bacterium]